MFKIQKKKRMLKNMIKCVNVIGNQIEHVPKYVCYFDISILWLKEII